MKTKLISTIMLLACIGIGTLVVRSKTQNFVTPTQRPPAATLQQAFPGDSRQVLENSESFVLYSINPERGFTGQGTFHDYTIVGKTEISDKQVRANLIAHFYAGMAADEIFAAGCFSPRHGIRATSGKKTVDMLICFSCSGVNIYYGEEVGRTHVANTPQRFYDYVLTNAGVLLSPN